MSFEVGKQVTNSNTSISRESFEKQEGINKLKKEELNAVWDRFDMNNDGQLDQDEQVGLMAFLKNLAATDEGKDDNKLTRKEVRHARKDEKNVLNSFGENVKLSYKDIKRVSNAFNNLVGNQGAEVQRKDAENYTVGQNAYTINKGTGTVNSKTTKTGTTNYNYDANNDIEKKTVTEGEGNDKKVTTTEYQNFEGVKIKKKEVATVGTDEDKTVTTTQYTGIVKDGKPVAGKTQEKVVNNETARTTDFDPNTDLKKQEVTEITKTKEKTVDKFNNKGELANRTKSKNGKTVTYTTYTPGGATETQYDETGNNIARETTYSNYNQQTGEVNNDTKKEETVYEKGKKINTTYKDGKKTGVTTTYTDSGTVVTTTYKDGKEATTTTKYKDGKTVTHDRGKRQLTVKTKEGKTTTVSTDENGGVATFPKFNGKRMETAGEAADRLGLKGKAKDAFVKKYGGEKAVLKAGTKLEIPKEAAIDKDFKADNVEVNGAAEAEKLKVYKAEQHRKEVQENIKNAPTKAKEAAKSMGLRQTWATGPNLQYQIYSKPTYAKTITGADGKSHTVSTAKDASKVKGNYQQHYIYNPQNNRMVPLESQIKGLKQGEHVRLITSDGYATVINDKGEERRIKLNFNSSLMATVDDKPVKTSDYNASFKKDYVANKGELKDADGNAIKNAEGKAIKTNLYEGRIVDGKAKSVMTYQAGEYIETTNSELYNSEEFKEKTKGYEKTAHPNVFRNSLGELCYYNSALKIMRNLGDGIELSNDGKTVTYRGKQYPTGEWISAQTVNDIAQERRGDESVNLMATNIKNKVNESNVIEFLDAYDSYDFTAKDSSVIDTMTSEWLSPTGRNDSYNAAKHIIDNLVKRAKKAGVDPNNDAFKKATSWDKNFDNRYLQKTNSARHDSYLAYKTEDIISDLASAIKEQEQVAVETKALKKATDEQDAKQDDNPDREPTEVKQEVPTAPSPAATTATAATEDKTKTATTTTTGKETVAATTVKDTAKTTTTDKKAAPATNLTNVPTHIIKKNGLPDYAQTHSGVLDSFDIDESLAVRLEDAMEKYHLSIPEDLSVYVNTPTFVDGNGNYYRYSEPDGGIIPDGDPQPETKHIQYIKV